MKNLCTRILLASILLFNLANAAEAKLTITINQYVNHIALDSAYEGIKKALEDRGFKPDNMKLVYANAQGNIGNAIQIAKNHASLKPDFMVGIATPSAQANLKAGSKVSKIAFVAVTDPIAANLTGQDNLIGVSDNPPIQELFELLPKIFVKLNTIGIIYNPGEINSIKIIEKFEQIAAEKNIKIKKVPIGNSSDVKMALSKLDKQVEAIYLPQDNTVISALESIVAISKKMEIALIANDPTLVDKGVLLALGTNYYNSGMQLGNMISDIMEGKELSKKIQTANINELKINLDVARALNLNVPESILNDKRLVK